MLSDKQLERVSTSYRDGYRDGYSTKTPKIVPELTTGPFAKYDYEAGYNAGSNDAKWDNTDRRNVVEAKTAEELKEEFLPHVRQMTTKEITEDLRHSGAYHRWYTEVCTQVLNERVQPQRS